MGSLGKSTGFFSGGGASLPGTVIMQPGGYDASTNTPDLDTSPSSDIFTGYSWNVTAAGDFFTEAVEIGDQIIALQDAPTTLAHWLVIQNNIFQASETEKGYTRYSTDAETLAKTETEAAITAKNLAALVVDEDDMVSDSNTRVPTQQSVKKYVDDQVATKDEASEISYDNSSSGLAATDVQAAIDENDGRLDTLEGWVDQDVTSGSSPTLDGANITGVDAVNVDIADAGDIITATDVEGALAENRGAIDTLETLVDQDVTSGSSPTLDGTNFTGIPDGALDSGTVIVSQGAADAEKIVKLNEDGVLNAGNLAVDGTTLTADSEIDTSILSDQNTNGYTQLNALIGSNFTTDPSPGIIAGTTICDAIGGNDINGSITGNTATINSKFWCSVNGTTSTANTSFQFQDSVGTNLLAATYLGVVDGYSVWEMDASAGYTNFARLRITLSGMTPNVTAIRFSSSNPIKNELRLSGTIDKDLIPDTDEAYDLGSAANKFKDLYLAGSSIYLGTSVLTNNAGVLEWDGERVDDWVEDGSISALVPKSTSPNASIRTAATTYTNDEQGDFTNLGSNITWATDGLQNSLVDGTNLALGITPTVDGTFGGAASNITDGDNGTQHTSLNYGVSPWFKIDLSSNQTVNKLGLRVASAGGTGYVASIEYSTDDISYTPVYTASSDEFSVTATEYEYEWSGVSARYWRITYGGSNSNDRSYTYEGRLFNASRATTNNTAETTLYNSTSADFATASLTLKDESDVTITTGNANVDYNKNGAGFTGSLIDIATFNALAASTLAGTTSLVIKVQPVGDTKIASVAITTQNTELRITTDGNIKKYVNAVETADLQDAYDHISNDGSDHSFINQDVSTTASPSFSGLTATAKVDITGSTEQGGVGEEMDVVEYVGDSSADHVLVKLLGIVPTAQDYAEIWGGEDGSGQFGKGFIVKHDKAASSMKYYYSSSGAWDGTEVLLFTLSSTGVVTLNGLTISDGGVLSVTDTLTSAASDDIVYLGDTDGSNELKKITVANLLKATSSNIADAYVSSAVASASITSGTPVNFLANSTIADAGNTGANWTVDNTNKRFTYTGATTLKFDVHCQISFVGNVTANNSVATLIIKKNGTTELNNYDQQRKLGTAADVGNMGISGTIEMAQNDYIEIMIDTDTSNSTYTPSKLVFKAHEA